MNNCLSDQVKETYYNQIHSKDTLRECRQFINELFVSNSGENMKFVERNQFILEPKSNQFENEIHFLAEESFSHKYENLVKSINQKISESKWANHELMRYFKPESVIQVGQKLENLVDLEKLNVVGKSYKCNVEEGKIFLIYIWTIYKPICKKQLAWLNDIFIKHNWDNNAKFISINTDHNREYAQKLIRLLHIDHMENLYIDQTKFPNHPLFNVANKYGYPASILVNNDNLIDLCGSLFEINLEEKIESLLKRERTTKMNFYQNLYLDTDEIKKLKGLSKKLQSRLSEHIHDVNANHLYGATLKIKKIYTTKKENDFISEKRRQINKKTIAELDYYAHTSDIHILDHIFEGMEEIPKLKITRNVVETYEVPYNRNPICSLCKTECNNAYLKLFATQSNSSAVATRPNKKSNLKKEKKETKLNQNQNTKSYYNYNEDSDEISEEEMDTDNYFAYYFCSTCNEFYCYNCGNAITDVTDTQKMHKHFLLYIHTNNRLYMKYILNYNIDTSHDMDFKYFFENSKTEKLSEIASHYQVKCDSCLSFPIRTVRWKCCNCVSRNICDKCKTRLETKDEEYYEDIIWNMHHVGCDPLHHVFMKVLFDCFVY